RQQNSHLTDKISNMVTENIPSQRTAVIQRRDKEIRRICERFGAFVSWQYGHPRKRIFPKRDRLERLRRRSHPQGGFAMLASIEMTIAQIMAQMSTPIPKNTERIYPEWPLSIGESSPEVVKLGETSLLLCMEEPVANLIAARKAIDRFYANRAQAMRERPINQPK